MIFSGFASQKNRVSLKVGIFLFIFFAAFLELAPKTARASVSRRSKKQTARCSRALTDNLLIDLKYELVNLSPEFVGEELGTADIFVNPSDPFLADYFKERGAPRIPYLNERARQAFKVHVTPDGLLRYRASEKDPVLVRFNVGTIEDTAIYLYVMDARGNIYFRRAADSKKHSLGYFHMSGVVAGAPVAAAGRVKVLNGKIQVAWTGSMTYKTGNIHLQQFLRRLKELGADISETRFEFVSPL